MEWKAASVGLIVSFRGGAAVIVGIERKKGHDGQNTVCLIRLDGSHQIACKVSDLELGAILSK